jgi:hypothetical protein
MLESRPGFEQGFAFYNHEFHDGGSTALDRGVVGQIAESGTDRRDWRTALLRSV